MTAEPISVKTLQCMELWGGNQAIEKAVATPGLDMWISSLPHEGAAAGGDVHYISLCGGGQITRILLADVSGHGATVATVAKSLRDLMRKHINHKDQLQLIQGINREFAEFAKMNWFATAVVATYLTKGDTFNICNAGHPRPFWWQASTKEWVVLAHDGTVPAGGMADLPLGIIDDMAYTQHQITLGSGDLILIYTDALIEAENSKGEQLGEKGLLAIVKTLDVSDPALFYTSLITAIDNYRGGKPSDDDSTFILLRHTAAPSRPPGFMETLNVYAKVLGLKSV